MQFLKDKVKSVLTWFGSILGDAIRTNLKWIITGLLALLILWGIWQNLSYLLSYFQDDPVIDPVDQGNQSEVIQMDDSIYTLNYVQEWLNQNAPYVLKTCIPQKLKVSECKGEIK